VPNRILSSRFGDSNRFESTIDGKIDSNRFTHL